jgi:hypothetical protein
MMEADLAEAARAFRRGDWARACALLERASQGLAGLTRVDPGQPEPYSGSSKRERVRRLREQIDGLLIEIQTQVGATRRELEILRSQGPETRWFETRA